MTDRIALHGHAYQPPRADPWTGTVPVETGAAPYRDWNERITAECYAPCTATRLYDGHGRVTAIVNLFEQMSFDLAPTLARWLAVHAPAVHDAMVAADSLGHTALAHPFHHVILPLASPRDVRTELRWGVADFVVRFGRRPDGMWLPETAIDPMVAAALAEADIDFTIVGPHQVAVLPPPGSVARVGRDGPRLVIFDGATSHALAFGAALGSAETLIDHLCGASDVGLAVAATDVETFGHHHRFSERAVGHALFEQAPARGLHTGALIDLMEGLAVHDVGTVVTSAWSCAHGVRRWHSDCGCATDAREGSHQRWRQPLREALTILANHADDVFAAQGAEVFHDAWAARDAYGEVLADPAAWERFVETHVRPVASAEQARLLLAAQEARLASFTSCAWFFADVLRPETAIVMQEAARAGELLGALGAPPPLTAAWEVLDAAVVDAGPGSPRDGAALWAWALAERDASVGHHWQGQRWDAETPVATLVADLVERAAAGDRAAARQAADVVSLSSQAGATTRFERAQAGIYRVLRQRGRAGSDELVALGEALGLATEVVMASAP